MLCFADNTVISKAALYVNHGVNRVQHIWLRTIYNTSVHLGSGRIPESCVALTVSPLVNYGQAASCATKHADCLANHLQSPSHTCSSSSKAKCHQPTATSHKRKGSAKVSADQVDICSIHMCVQGCKDNAVDGRPRIKNLEQ